MNPPTHQEKIAQLLNSYQNLIKKLSFKFQNSITGYEVEDLIQEANLCLMKTVQMRLNNPDKYKHPYDMSYKYINDTIVTHFIDLQRKTKSRKRVENEFILSQAEELHYTDDTAALQLLDCLTEEEKQILLLKVAKYTNIEIGQALDINRRHIKVVLDQIQRKIERED